MFSGLPMQLLAGGLAGHKCSCGRSLLGMHKLCQGSAQGPELCRAVLRGAGNDLSRVFAPLIRDGRMQKFYWHPTREDLVGILYQVRYHGSVLP